MDKIFLYGMKADTLIGVYDWERQHQQTIVLDLEISVSRFVDDLDDIGCTIHYGEVYELVCQHLSTRNFMLLETLAQDVVHLLFSRFDSITQLRVCVVKPGILSNVREVGVEIFRQRHEMNQ